ncbi:MAG: T9SS type A sorting domain-containing protein [Bacteroidota bacterium]
MTNQIKTIAFFFTALLLLNFSMNNQTKAAVANYTFASSSGNYTAIVGNTLFSGAWDDEVSALLTIPFTFTYNGNAFTSLAVASNGYITMGAVPTNIHLYCGVQTCPPNSIAGYGTDLVPGAGTSVVSYLVLGTTPNRQFVVQWSNVNHYANTDANSWNFQIVLNETSNTIQVIWGANADVTAMGANTCSDVSTESGNVGLVGSDTSDHNIRKITNGINTWAASALGTAISDVCNMSSTNVPALGLTYTWTPPAPVPMSYVSSTTAFINNGQGDGLNSIGNQILQLKIVTLGNQNPFNLTSINLNTTGCTNSAHDVANAKVYYTGINNVFSTTTQFGVSVANPNGPYAVTGSVTLAEGINYFWVTYDITTNATVNDLLSGCITQMVGTGTMGTQAPTISCPIGNQTIADQGYWTPLVHASPNNNEGVMLLLSDGTVMCKTQSGGSDGYGNLWDKLTPDINGSYVNGTWTTLAPSINTRLYFSSEVLRDGRVYVAGGEYGTGNGAGEFYNPLTNTWTLTPSTGHNYVDANSAILPDGKVLQACEWDNFCFIWDPITNTYAAGPSTHGTVDESAWVKLPDNSILFVDMSTLNSERYIPSLNQWIVDAQVPVMLYDPYGSETGGAFLLPNGKAFFIGALGYTAYYTPSGNNSPGTWAAGPSLPNGLGTPDAPGAMMVNGKILFAASPIPTSSDHFPAPTFFYEFDYITNTYNIINTPFGGSSANMSTYVANMLDLPDGNILYSTQYSTQYYVYTPSGSPLAAGKPTIANVTQTSCTDFSITGTLFNGIGEGACYGDDWQNTTNYPIIRLKDTLNHVYYARTFNWNRTGVQTASLPDTTQFTIPATLPHAIYTLVVTANGIASDPIQFIPFPMLSSSLTPNAVCSNTPFNYTPTTYNNATYSWTRAAVSGISNPAITTPQTTPISETLINTTTSTVTVNYSFILSANGCTDTQAVTVLIKPQPAVTFTGLPDSTCSNAANITLSGTPTGGTFTGIGIISNNILNPTAITGNDTITYTFADTNGCSNTYKKVITVYAAPTVSFTGLPDTICLNGSTRTMTGTPAGGTFSGHGVIANTFNPSTLTTGHDTITYTYTDTHGCQNTSTHIIYLSPCTGIPVVQNTNIIDFNAYPNPANDNLTVTFRSTDQSTYSITLCDVLGRTIYSTHAKATTGINTNTINLNPIARGIYLLTITKSQTTLQKKIILN